MTENQKNQIVEKCFVCGNSGVLIHNKKTLEQLALQITDKIRIQKNHPPVKVYKPTEMLEQILDFIKETDFTDLTITSPHKIDVTV